MITPGKEPEVDTNWLGVERWILRTLTTHEQRNFLLGFRRLCGKYIHPDTTQEADKKHTRNYFFQKLNEAVDAFQQNPVLPEHTVDPTIFFKMQIIKLQEENLRLKELLAKSK